MKTTQARINIRRANERGHADHGWLNSYHTFSFANYHDSKHMGFRSLRVINDDSVNGGMGFGTHPHRDMEIISYVVQGTLEHQDSMGNGSVIREGQVQRITAGSGITHSEFNHSDDDPVHFLQIWIKPNERGLEPSYAEMQTDPKAFGLQRIASPEESEGGVSIHQDARIHFGRLKTAESTSYGTTIDRGLWIQMIQGELSVAGEKLRPGDGISIENVVGIDLLAISDAEFILFDLA